MKWLDLIFEVLQKTEEPMSAEEIWEKALEMKLDQKLNSFGKTPWATIGAQLYVNIRDNGENSQFIQVSRRPARFSLRALHLNAQQLEKKIERIEEAEIKKSNESHFNERDLHPLLVKYAMENPHFHCYTKTIYQENSVRRVKGVNEWLHPDLVGVYFPFGDYSSETTKLQSSMNVNSIKLFSFEMKKHLDYGNLRQCFFQAVSNSSWANEGYLVCLKINSEADFKNELQRLSNAFGIGIIRLNVENITDSDIVCPARYNENIDWDTLDRLADDSPGFKKFISGVVDDNTVKNVRSTYDKVLLDDEFENYLKEKGIV